MLRSTFCARAQQGDFDGDGRIELVLAQNHFTREAETGLWRGNPGCHLEWEGGDFEVIPHERSGTEMTWDTRSLVVLDGGRVLVGQNNSGLLLFEPWSR